MTDALIIFVRNPELGKVKTRLAATLGPHKALEIYYQLLEHTFVATKDLAAPKYVFYAGCIAADDQWHRAGYHQLVQKGAGLGEKMDAAFQTVFEKGHGKVIIIGSDCIELTCAILQQAFNLLDKYDVVIGPANDGGYYLLGMKKLYPAFFQQKEWSTEKVYDATISDCNKQQLSYFPLPVLIDIDTEEDWSLFQKGHKQKERD